MITEEAIEAAWITLAVGMDCDPQDRGMFETQLHEALTAALEAAAPFIRAQALEDAADAIDMQRDATNPDRNPEETWSVIDHREGRFLGKTVAARLLRARAVTERGGE